LTASSDESFGRDNRLCRKDE